MVAEGYGPETLRDFIARFGSIREAEAHARSTPGFGEAIREVERDLDGLMAWIPFANPELVPLTFANLQARRRDLIVAALGGPGLSGGRQEYGPWPRVKAEKAAKLRVETQRGRTWIGREADWSERQVGYLIDLLELDPPALIWNDELGLMPGTGWDTKGVPGGRSIIVRRIGTT